MPYYSPGYRVGCAFIFEFPDVFTEFGAGFLFLSLKVDLCPTCRALKVVAVSPM